MVQKFDSWRLVSQLVQFIQINATLLTLDIDWPPSIQRLVHTFKAVLLLTFDVIPVSEREIRNYVFDETCE